MIPARNKSGQNFKFTSRLKRLVSAALVNSVQSLIVYKVKTKKINNSPKIAQFDLIFDITIEKNIANTFGLKYVIYFIFYIYLYFTNMFMEEIIFPS